MCVALGVALGFAGRRRLPHALGALVLAAIVASFVSTPAAWQDAVFLGLWASIALTAASVHLPTTIGPRAAVALSINAGLWAGLATASAGSRLDLMVALPCALICIPAAWAVARGWGLGIKVASSWLIAIAILAAGLTLVPTPGYKPDHMD